MKIFAIIFCLLVPIVNNVTAQSKSKKVDVLWGEELKESKKNTLSDIIAYDHTGFYALKIKMQLSSFKKSIIVEHFNNKMNKTNSVKLDLKYKNKDKYFKDLLYLDDVIYLFTFFPDKKKKGKRERC